VSGHLLGQGGTHAWVEVVVPEARRDGVPEARRDGVPEARRDGVPEARRGAIAVPFDPCNGRRAGSGYVTVAAGRDYADVAPTSGTYVGTAKGRLTAGRRVGILAASD
jgi:transglutaminase-like putative cysteine protease